MSVSLEAVRKLVEDDMASCDIEQSATFRKYSVEPYFASIVRYGRVEQVAVVARRENEVIYWEDEEEGFNVSPLALDGRILEHWCNQDELGLALNVWIEGRSKPPRVGPAVGID